MVKMTVLALLALTSANAVAADPAALVQRDCMSCHGNEVYTRKDRMVNSLDALRHQINRCHQATGKNWTPEDVEAVVQYLNRGYYKF